MHYKPLHRNHVWSYDFVGERTEDGRQLKLLIVIDEFTRECLAIEPGRSFTARGVILSLQYLFAVRGAPEQIRSDNGPEFVAKEIQKWLGRVSVDTLYIQKASPWENGYVESFNGKLRDELLNGELFLSLAEARYVLDEWRLDYNHRRPHSSLNWQTPAAYTAGLHDEKAGGVFPSGMLADPPVGATPLPTAQQAATPPILFYEPGCQDPNHEILKRRIGSLFYPSFHVAIKPINRGLMQRCDDAHSHSRGRPQRIVDNDHAEHLAS